MRPGSTNDVAFVTDGQLSGLCNKGLTVAEVSPESAVGGPLALVENGDRITIDVDARARLDLDVAESGARGAPRLAAATRRCQSPADICRSISASVQPMSTGAVLDISQGQERHE